MPDPLLIFHLLARHRQPLGVLHDYEVAAVGYRVVNGFVLALQQRGDASSKTTNRRA